jgi:hypothetical protein
MEGAAVEESDEGVEEVGLVFSDGGDVAAQAAESVSAGGGSKGAGDFKFDFDHADVALGEVVIERDAEIVGESEHFRLSETEAFEEVSGLAFFGASAFRRVERHGRGAFSLAAVEKGLVVGGHLG